ncbi:MAG: hypothetical protein QN178_03310 [Armatimonadota bacterium]|nr:hypothetical protein [Armatimonadota bacterium]
MHARGFATIAKATGMALVIALLASATLAALAAPAPVSPQAKLALIDAATSELKALALYQAVVKKFGDHRPFASWIKTGPERIDEQLKPLFTKYGVAMPAAPDAAKVQAPASFKDACRMANQIEGERVALYEQFLKTIKESDIVAAFTEMRDAARRRLNGVREHCE